jgi:hypothetical protein
VLSRALPISHTLGRPVTCSSLSARICSCVCMHEVMRLRCRWAGIRIYNVNCSEFDVIVYVFSACCVGSIDVCSGSQKASEWVGIYISHGEKSDAGIRTVEYGFGDSCHHCSYIYLVILCHN